MTALKVRIDQNIFSGFFSKKKLDILKKPQNKKKSKTFKKYEILEKVFEKDSERHF